LNYIVLADPTSVLHRGTVIDEYAKRSAEAARGIVTLPYIPEFSREHASAGLFERFYGAGQDLGDGCKITRVAHAFLYVVKSETARRLHWVTRLERTERTDVPGGLSKQPFGSLRLVTDNRTIPNITTLGDAQTNIVEFNALPEADADGGWYVKGAAPVGTHESGFLNLCLSGTSPSMRVMWIAVSQAP
jgi:hypothetical protein